jgi:t-SNARE complex subunit (syntaxin)
VLVSPFNLQKCLSITFRTAYDKATERYQDVLTLERSLADLHQLFLDFALLTEHQAEYLDQIEYHVKSANEHVEDGNLHLHKAVRYLKKIQKKRCLVRYVLTCA